MRKPLTDSQIADHAQALGVSRGASAEEVRDAWRKAARRSHPDLTGGQTDREMSRINAAFDALKNGVPQRGARASISPRPPTPAPAGTDFFFPLALRKALIRDALEVLEERGEWTPGIVARLRRALDARIDGLLYCPMHIHVPFGFSYTGNHVMLFFRGEMQKGQNFIAAPNLKLGVDGSTLVGRNERPTIIRGVLPPDTLSVAQFRIQKTDFLHGFPETLVYGRFH